MRIYDDFSNCENKIRLDGKVAVVTGSSSGIGKETALKLAKRGAKVILANRNEKKMKETRDHIVNITGNKNIIGRHVDFESLASVRKFAHEMCTYEPRLDILINNVGAIGLDDRLTGDKLHLMMQVNYFGAFLLTFLLYPLLKMSAPSRIINVSSISLLLGHIDFEHMNDVGRYSSFGLYANAKLADILFTVEMNKRINGSGVNVYSMDPGLAKSDFLRNYKATPFRKFLSQGLMLIGKPLDRVAMMPVFLATDPRVENSSGKHFLYCVEFFSSWFANDTRLTKKLWEESKTMVGINKSEDWEYNDNNADFKIC